jgi:hypothetical protein
MDNTPKGELAPIYAERIHLLEGLPSFTGPAETPEQQARHAAWDAPFGPPDVPECQIEERRVSTLTVDVPIRIYRPPGSSRCGMRTGVDARRRLHARRP